MSLFAELKRRNVFRVGAAYAVLAWLLIQVFETVLPVFGAPAWVLQTLIFILLLGFPIALVLAWAFELTPEGIKSQQSVDDSGIRSSSSKLNVIIIAGLSLAVVTLILRDFVVSDEVTEPAVPTAMVEANANDSTGEITETAGLAKSLAVLPFTDLSPDKDQEYFSDGLSEELLNKLAQVQDLLVTARTSSFYYKGRNEDMRTIGQELGVNYILEGSVRKADDNVRITAQLIQADNGFHLWSQTYDRKLVDIFDLQDEIATAVTEALSITLGAGAFDLPGMTRNVAAFEALLKAASAFQNANQETVRAGFEQVELAVRLDPAFYIAWNLMVQMYDGTAQIFPADEAREYQERAEQARKVLRENAADMPAAQEAEVAALLDAGRFVEAEQKIQDLIAATGNATSPFNWRYAALLSNVGRGQAALPYFQAARRQDPLNIRNSILLTRTYLGLGRENDARAETTRAMESIEGGFVGGILGRVLWYAAIQDGDHAAAVEAYKGTIDRDIIPGSLEDYWIKGDTESALALVRRNLDRENATEAEFSAWAQWAMMLGDPQLAIDVYRQQGIDSPNIWMDMAADLRKLPDFRLFMEETGIADYWRTTGNWADKCRPVNDTFECF